jgi:hypothetical protein
MRLLTQDSSCRPQGPNTNSAVVDLQYKSPTFSPLPDGTRAGGERNKEEVLPCDTMTRMMFWHVANSGAYYPTMFVEAGSSTSFVDFPVYDARVFQLVQVTSDLQRDQKVHMTRFCRSEPKPSTLKHDCF